MCAGDLIQRSDINTRPHPAFFSVVSSTLTTGLGLPATGFDTGGARFGDGVAGDELTVGIVAGDALEVGAVDTETVFGMVVGAAENSVGVTMGGAVS